MISQKINRSRRHIQATHGESLYHIRRYDFRPSVDTWEPTAHLQHSKIVSYYNKRKLKLPYKIKHVINGCDRDVTTIGLILSIF